MFELGWIVKIGELALGIYKVLKGLLPSTEQKLGAAQQQVVDEKAVIDAQMDKKRISDRVDGMSDADVDKQLRGDWPGGH